MTDRKTILMVKAMICALTLTLTFSVTSFAKTAQSVRTSCVRLHILANSDSDKDQKVKLLVRDALLESGSALFSGVVTADNAAQILDESKEQMIAVAEKVLNENGLPYGADIVLCNEYFTTRTYGDYTLPAGRYTAVKVLLGEAEGHNWWCVMFPPLCLPGFCETNPSAYLTEDGSSLIEEDPKLEPRFKIVEWYEKLSQEVNGSKTAP